MTTTAALQIGSTGTDLLCIHGAQIADPHNDPAVTWDDDQRPVFVIEVDAADDEQPYRDALEAAGLTVIGHTGSDWIVSQTRPLQSA